MRILLKTILSVWILIPLMIKAQDINLSPCGTEMTPEIRNWYHSLNHDFRKNLKIASGELYIPVIIHIVGNDNGTGYFPKDQAFQLMCELNRHFQPVNIRFFLADTFYYINNSRYFNHDWNDGYDMMQNNNVPTVMNVYVVQNPSDACGYAYYPGGGPGNGRGGIALAKSCARPDNSTFPHEVGHYLSLPHTFDNWNSGMPEFVNGTNCSSAGDYFCDTPADFLDFRWNCPYTGSQTDPNGDLYQPDGSFFMSYSIEPCGNRFSQEQMDAMRLSRTLDRPYLNAVPPPAYFAEQTVNLVVPNNNAQVPSSGFMLRWNKIPGVSEYAGLITPINSYVFATVKFYTTDTFYYVNQFLENGKNYKWKVIPITPYYPCIDPDTMTGSFNFTIDGSLTGLEASLEAGQFEVYPNPSSVSTLMTISFSWHSKPSALHLQDLMGRTLKTIETDGSNALTLDLSGLQPGCYLLRSGKAEEKGYVKQIVIY